MGWEENASFNNPNYFKDQIIFRPKKVHHEDEYYNLKLFAKYLLSRKDNIIKGNAFINKLKNKLYINKNFELPDIELGCYGNFLLKEQIQKYKIVKEKRNYIYYSLKNRLKQPTWFIYEDADIAVTRVILDAKN